MSVTPKTVRMMLISIVIVAVVLAGLAAAKIFFTDKALVIDGQGCVWEEVSPLRMTDHEKTSSEGYQTKTENGKQYLLRECKKQEVKND